MYRITITRRPDQHGFKDGAYGRLQIFFSALDITCHHDGAAVGHREITTTIDTTGSTDDIGDLPQLLHSWGDVEYQEC